MKKSIKWDKIHSKNEVFWIFYKMEPSRIHDSNLFGSYINSKLVCPKWWEPDLRFFSCYLWIIITSKLLKLESSETTQIKEFSKLFKTILDFNGLSFLVIEQSLIKGLRPLFFLPLSYSKTTYRLQNHTMASKIIPTAWNFACKNCRSRSF